MPTLKKRQSGWLAKKQGQTFQKTCEMISSSQGIIALPIADGVRKSGPGGRILTPVPNLFDLILVDSRSHKVIFTDCKVRDKSHLTISDFKTTASRLIAGKKRSTERQLDTMAMIATSTPHIVGFTILLKPLGRVAFVHVKDILKAKPREIIPMDFISPTQTPNFRLLLDTF
jgi:hypothetical protein